MHSPTLINRLRVLLKWTSSKKRLILFHLTIREVFSKLTVMMINHLICTQILTFLTLWYIHVRVRMRDITTVFLKFHSKNSQIRQCNSGPNFFYYLTWNNNGTEDSYNGYQREEEGRNSAICISIVNTKQLITYNPILKAYFPEPTDILFYIQYDVKRDNWVILQCPES